MTVLIATGTFKGSLGAGEVTSAVAAGIREVIEPGIVIMPVADGGDGTVAAVVAAGFTPVPVVASGPTRVPVAATWARCGDTAVIEMADVCGLARLPGGRLEPLTATSHGLGEVIAAAIEAGCSEIIVGVGGSASTDGGAGLVRALGARLLDVDGRDVGDGGAALPGVAAVDLTALHRRIAGVRIVLASDVDNPLVGPRGSAAVYGPQKGASEAAVTALDAALSHWADVVSQATGRDDRDRPGAGAAGGVGYAALALLGAELRPGIDLVLELVGFGAALDGAVLVVTGEGSLDEQTLHGKTPAGVAAAAAARGIPVVAVCGRTSLTPAQLEAAGIRDVYALTDLEPDEQRCLAEPAPLLVRLGAHLARDQLLTPRGPRR